MAYWQLFYHLVWPTHENEPLLLATSAPHVHALIRQRVQTLGGTLYAVGGQPDHVHLVVAVPPQIALSLFVGQVKSWTTRRINRDAILSERFAWHQSYGVVTFDRARLPYVIAYVEEQATHHGEGTTIPALEHKDGAPSTLAQAEYQRVHIDNQKWLTEMLALDASVFD